MTTKEKLHRLVDELPAEKVEKLFQFATQDLRGEVEKPVRRRLHMAGIIEADADLSVRYKEIRKDLASQE